MPFTDSPGKEGVGPQGMESLREEIGPRAHLYDGRQAQE